MAVPCRPPTSSLQPADGSPSFWDPWRCRRRSCPACPRSKCGRNRRTTSLTPTAQTMALRLGPRSSTSARAGRPTDSREDETPVPGAENREYNGGKILPSAAEQDGLIDPGNRRRAIEYVDQYFPGLVPEPYAETTCLFTNTPTEDFILDRVDGLTILSPCSGHGAKFAPLIGQLAAELATGAGLTGSRDSRRLVRGRFPAGWTERQPRPERRPCPRAAPAVSAAGGRQNPGSVPSRRDAGVPRQS